MNRVPSPDSSVLEYRGVPPTHITWWIGLVCLFALVGAIVLGVANARLDSGLGIGIVAAGVALVLIALLNAYTAVCGFAIDKRNGTVRTWTGWVAPVFSNIQSLQQFNAVQMAKDGRGFKGKDFVYPVSLVGVGVPVELCAASDRLAARRLAEDVALHLNLPLIDDSIQPTVRTEADRVGKSIVDSGPPQTPRHALTARGLVSGLQLSLGSFRAAMPSAPFFAMTAPEPTKLTAAVPPALRAHVTFDGSRVRIEIPRPSLGKFLFIPFLFGLVAGGFVAILAFLLDLIAEGGRNFIVVVYIFLGIATIVFLASVIYSSPEILFKFSLDAGRDRVHATRGGPFGNQLWSFNSREIREVRHVEFGSLVVINDAFQEARIFAGALEPTDVKWIADVIKEAIVA